MEPSSKAWDGPHSETYFPFCRVEAGGDGRDLKEIPERAEPGAPESH